VGPYGARYENAIDLSALRRAHKPQYSARTDLSVDGNTAAAIPFLQWWRAPILPGFPITPSTRWLEHLVRVVDGAPRIVPGRESDVAALQAYADRNLERLEKIAQLL
jgi:hypothetical protein